ncbi:MAG: 1-(5-phosphoribosyl)-5-((5-phosphoribosylamino)methylideneamino)imidazole-4-carboxamide isomerase, partial [Chloroflexi bacterium]|nr:1-(5-phosphoribosyl)-5-((5-phosphoribosylamino)methylideneamino)imidazole-4-carboxamide isomerase [Chloroflexota bacterium]
QTGGGLRDLEALRAALAAGVARVVLGTAAVKDPALLEHAVATFGEQLVVSVDARDGHVRVEGWTEGSAVEAGAFVAELVARGVRRIVYTDISRDGVADGPNVEAYAALVARGDVAVIAAGGVSRLDDVRALARAGVEAAIVGRALYTGDVALEAALEAAAC